MSWRRLQREIVLMKRSSARRRATVKFPDLGSCLAAAWLSAWALSVTAAIKKKEKKKGNNMCTSVCLSSLFCSPLQFNASTHTVEGSHRQPGAMAWARGQELEIFRSDGISQPASSNSSRAEKAARTHIYNKTGAAPLRRDS